MKKKVILTLILLSNLLFSSGCVSREEAKDLAQSTFKNSEGHKPKYNW